MTCHLEDSVSCIELFPIMTSEFLVLPSVNPEDLISGSNSGLRVVGGFHKSLEQQKKLCNRGVGCHGVVVVTLLLRAEL